ncbi:unnamed protein product [Caenorhabditis bovis]|uniref:Uncharacterized protein n=1 Tax=Caenorhabditis bovis TaxID=2654633 RepID=A0A8S1F4Z8_9PELO|nr:unnamed protein product [Caenorhabditis bovis]
MLPITESAVEKKVVEKRAASATNIMPPTKSDGGGVEWKPPPENERPKHPGFETPIEATEETKTQYQINKFRDAADFV